MTLIVPFLEDKSDTTYKIRYYKKSHISIFQSTVTIPVKSNVIPFGQLLDVKFTRMILSEPSIDDDSILDSSPQSVQ